MAISSKLLPPVCRTRDASAGHVMQRQPLDKKLPRLESIKRQAYIRKTSVPIVTLSNEVVVLAEGLQNPWLVGDGNYWYRS
ncbi:hypothetical protein Y032_0073g753 [Ancylostoma ceylanicum]|uniref:Uncharacterized protein n=1 Tax=Ancylostoma ceylanicum TaxID=53326 RepID=A0A016TV16_9BILA|nr:hypothetical protein Y032_0073g753 [Ancylostoma ceylanicum]